MADKVEGTLLHYADIIVIVGYFLIVLFIGLWSSCRNRGSVGGYFLAGRSMHWIPVGASLFASNIGSGHFIGLAGSGAASGIGISVFELNAIFILMILGWIFVPVYIASGVYTMPEYLRKRFGGERIRIYLSVLAILLYIFTKISADLYAGAVFLNQSLKWDLYASVLVLLAIAALFTIAGGLTAVIWTDFVQTIIMIIGAFVLMIISFMRVGGYQSIVQQFFSSWPNTTKYSQGPDYNYTKCGIPPDNSMHLLRDANDGSLPWTGVIIGLTISSVWYWCSDQVIVQRVLAAKNLSNAKGGVVLAGYLKILPMFLLVLPGMVARILYPDEVGCGDPKKCMEICGKERGCTDIAYPKLVVELMPDGARGLMLAVMISALMSSLTSIFNSGSTIFTMDIWRRIRKNASEMELMIVGRCFVLVLMGIGIAWIPVVQSGGELFHYIQAITSFLAPPICAVYVLALAWRRINEQGAFWGLMIGLVCGLIRFAWEYAYPVFACGQEYLDPKPDIISKVHYLHFGCILFLIVIIATTVISLATKPQDPKYTQGLTFATRHEGMIDDNEKEGIENPAMEMESKENLANNGETKIEQVDAPEQKDRNIRWCCRSAFDWICGIENLRNAENEAPPVVDKSHLSIEESDNARKFWNVQAVCLMAVAVFIWTFFH